MARMRPSLQLIAQRLGISDATVSNALHGTGRVSVDLREKVRALAKEIGYVPDHAGRALRAGRTKTIGLLVPDIANPVMATLLSELELAARRRGYGVMVANSADNPTTQASEIEALLARGADGLVIVPRRGSAIGPIHVPVAIISSAASMANTVSSDYRSGGRAVAAHLVALGHRSVLILGGAQTSDVGIERVSGMVEVFSANSVSFDIVYSEVTLDIGAALVQDWAPGTHTAIVGAYDLLALGALARLRERNIRIPEDVSLTGFDDLMWCRFFSPRLTSVRMDHAAVAEAAIARLGGEQGPATLIPTKLIIRKSSGPAHQTLVA
jgi:LacI family transcriptional regulator